MQYKTFNIDILKCDFDDKLADLPSDSKKGVAMPEAQKSAFGCKLIELPEIDRSKFTISLQEAIARRRSRRKFSQEALTIDELSFLLWATQGVTDGDVDAHRAVPSAGARHPFESYLVIRRVDGINPGVYRYLPLNHKLCLVSDSKDAADKLAKSCFEVNGAQMYSAAVIFAWTTIPYRSEWRYGSYAYKGIAIDVGHLCQNLYLGVEAVGCGVCAIAVYDQNSVDQLIGVDGKDEFTIYLATVGKI